MAASLNDILVLGHNGLVGQALLTAEPGLNVFAGGRTEFDLNMDFQRIKSALQGKKPATVINCTGMTHVDECQRAPAAAWQANSHGPAKLARACAELNIRLIHLSTDYVFDGHAGRPYKESDPVNPLNAYGKSKLAGELGVLLHHHSVVRTSWVYGTGREGWLERPWRQCQAGQPVRVVDDQVSCPTWAPDLARALLFLARSEASGLVHAAGNGHATRRDVCRYFFSLAGLDSELIQPAKSADFPDSDARPTFSAMDCARLEQLGFAMPPWHESMTLHWQAIIGTD